MMQLGEIRQWLVCKYLHREWHYGPIPGWASSLRRECQVCGRTWASGRMTWEAGREGRRGSL